MILLEHFDIVLLEQFYILALVYFGTVLLGLSDTFLLELLCNPVLEHSYTPPSEWFGIAAWARAVVQLFLTRPSLSVLGRWYGFARIIPG